MSQDNKKPWEVDYGTQEEQKEKKKPWEVDYGTESKGENKHVTESRDETDYSEPPSEWTNYARAAGQGLTMGFADEIEAKVRSTYQEGSYDDIVKTIRSENADFSEREPGTAIATEIIGGIPYFFVPGAGWVKASSALSKGAKAFNTAKNLGKLSAEGAGYGAAYGAGTADSGLENTLDGAGYGAGIGAVASPVLGGAIRLGSNAFKGIGASGVIRNRIEQAERFIKDPSVDFKTKMVIDGIETDMTVGDYMELKAQSHIISQVSEKDGDIGIDYLVESLNKNDKTAGDSGDRIKKALGLEPSSAEKIQTFVNNTFGKNIAEKLGLKDTNIGAKRIKAVNKTLNDSADRIKKMRATLNMGEDDLADVYSGLDLEEYMKLSAVMKEVDEGLKEKLTLSIQRIKEGDYKGSKEATDAFEDIIKRAQHVKGFNSIKSKPAKGEEGREIRRDLFEYNKTIKSLRKLAEKGGQDPVDNLGEALAWVAPIAMLAGGTYVDPILGGTLLAGKVGAGKFKSVMTNKGVNNLSEALNNEPIKLLKPKSMALGSKYEPIMKDDQASKEEPKTSWVGGKLFSTINEMSVDGFTVDEKKGLKVAIKDAYSELTSKEKAALVPLMTRLSIDIASGGTSK